ncbi:MAG: hypothetical protein ACFFDN_12640 [Candidatus Hodarchaeota archaeon]
MGSKAAGITGGILILVGAGLLFYLWFTVISPMITSINANAGISNLWVLDHLGYIMWCEDNAYDWQAGENLILYPDWIIEWYGTALEPDLTMTYLWWFMVQGNSVAPSSVFGIPLPVFIYMLIGILGAGAILAFVGAGED